MKPTDPRRVAFDVLRAVDAEDAYANLVLPSLIAQRHLDRRDAALATELVSGTIRLRGRYDAIIDSLANGGIAKLEAPVVDVLRLGAHQLLALRTPDHAAVSTSVALARSAVGHRVAGLVNAILRKIAERSLEEWMTEVTAGLADLDALATRSSHPRWIVEALNEAVGPPDQLELALEANNVNPPVTLVARPGLCDPAELPGTQGRWSPYARILDSGDPGRIEAVREGRAAVQDEGSQAVTLAFAERCLDGVDERWLDLCAGPGGKAGLLGAIAAQRGATLIANEVQPHRAELVRQAVRELPNIEVTVHDGRDVPWESGTFDRVLLDAPCSGLGALRRRPESRWRRQPADVTDLTSLQHELLLSALDLVRVGGVIGYVTCSPHLDETSRIVDAVIAEHPELTRLTADKQWWTHEHGTDAMFIALLTKTPSQPT